jgi:carboxylate-amine ligase
MTVSLVLAAGDLPDYTYLWWDVRPHPRLGTVEVRAMDAQSSLRAVAVLAALVHGLACHEADRAAESQQHLPHEALAESSFRAARDGLWARRSTSTSDSMTPTTRARRSPSTSATTCATGTEGNHD